MNKPTNKVASAVNFELSCEMMHVEKSGRFVKKMSHRADRREGKKDAAYWANVPPSDLAMFI